MKPAVRSLALAAMAVAASAAFAQKSPILRPQPLPADITPQVQPQQCGGFTGIYGPMDFRGIHPDDRRVVEAYHLEKEMGVFLSGRVEGTHRAGSGPIAGGFLYTVRAIPNHPVAMLLLEQLARKLKSERPQNIEWPLECMYVRAFMLVPDDPVVWAMYGIYLAHRNRAREAEYNLDRAEVALRSNGTLQYQIGLANLALKRYDKAQINAMIAAERGFNLPGLREQLQSAGKWQKDLKLPPPPAPATDDTPASAAAAAPTAAASANN